MRHKLISLITFIAISLSFTGNALAAWSFNITTNYTAGDTQAIFSLNLTTDEQIVLKGGYDFEFTYDQTELNFVGHTNTPITGFMHVPMFGEFSSDGSTGTLNTFTATGFAPTTVNAGQYELGTFTFNVINSNLDGKTDFDFDHEDNMLSYIVNNQNYIADENTAITHFTDVGPPSAVPVPAAIWLLGSGLVGLVGLKRKNAL